MTRETGRLWRPVEVLNLSRDNWRLWETKETGETVETSGST